MIGFKQENLGNGNFYTLRVSWTEPYYWNDEFDNTVNLEKNRGYNLNCFLETAGARGPNLVNIPVSYEFQGYSEKYQFPPDVDLFIQCAVQARNAKNFLGPWAYSRRIHLSEVPIYLSGLDGINVRGFSDQEIRNLRARIAEAANSNSVAASVSNDVGAG